MLDESNGPIIPKRTSVQTPSKHERGQRRRSLPDTTHRHDRRPYSNRVTVNPASTEVISSLIETLSAISSPAEQHFDSLPRISASHSTPVSPRPWQTEYPMIGEPPQESPQAAHLSIGKRPHGVDATYLLHPDHASTRSSLPRHSAAKLEKRSREGPKEPEDPYDLGEIYSIGNVSIEAKPWQSTTSLTSIGSDAQRSVRSIRSMKSLRTLGFKSSKDSLRPGDEKIVRKARRERSQKPERLVIEDNTPPHSPNQLQITVAKRNTRQSAITETPDVPDRASSVPSRRNSRRLYWNGDDVTSGPKSPGSMLNQEYIPTRNSSKRHSMRMSKADIRRSPRHSENSSLNEAKSASIDKNYEHLQKTLQEVAETPKTEYEPQPEAVEDFVTRRIRELKEQKMQRERSSIDTPTEFVSAPETPNRSLTSSPLPAASHSLASRFPPIAKESTTHESDTIEDGEDNEQSAPSPAIAWRTNRNSVVGSRPIREPLSTVSNEHKRRSFSTPQRSNSRLLRRLSRPTSPTTAAKHRRTFSNAGNEPLYDQFERDDRDSIGDAVDDFLTSARMNQRIKHAETGRVISFSEVGDPEGSVVFCCVGMGLTRFLTAFYDELATTLKLRLITPDRPGVGGSEPHADGLDTPLGWPDDVRAICQHLKITKFSIMAHSAGAIYALATALRMSQHIRCRVHLLAPWIPPSQMSVIGAQQDPLPTTALPYSQRILRALPTTFLRAANSSFLSTTSASITTSLPKSPRRNKAKNSRNESPGPDFYEDTNKDDREIPSASKVQKSGTDEDYCKENRPPLVTRSTSGKPIPRIIDEKDRKSSYETRLTEAIWEAATTGANPAVDLLVCLERRQPIGFRYVDITRAVVIHHGSKDTRVPVENVKWLGKTMRRCQVRILEGEGHGLMASAGVMGNVLMEMAQEWDDWNSVVRGKGGMDRRVTNAV